VRRKAFLVQLHECRLADGGAGLQVGQVGGALAEPEFADAGTNGSRTDEYDLAARRADSVELIRQRLDPQAIQFPRRIRQHVGPHLDDHRVRPADDFASSRIGHVSLHRSWSPAV
jgi:hypothetical protein